MSYEPCMCGALDCPSCHPSQGIEYVCPYCGTEHYWYPEYCAICSEDVVDTEEDEE